MNTAIAGLTAEQAKWIPQNAQGKHDANANHSVGMLAYHLVFWNENALARLHGEKPEAPTTNDETFNDFDAARWTAIVQRLDRVMKALETEVEKMPEEKLAQVAPTISHISLQHALAGLVEGKMKINRRSGTDFEGLKHFHPAP